jgi:hypothetical protein
MQLRVARYLLRPFRLVGCDLELLSLLASSRPRNAPLNSGYVLSCRRFKSSLPIATGALHRQSFPPADRH